MKKSNAAVTLLSFALQNRVLTKVSVAEKGGDPRSEVITILRIPVVCRMSMIAEKILCIKLVERAAFCLIHSTPTMKICHFF